MHGIRYIYPLVDTINSQPIPELFNPRIFTPSRRNGLSENSFKFLYQ